MSSGRTCESSAWDSSSSTRRCSATSSWPRSHLNLVSRFMPGGIPISLGCLFIWLQKKASIPLCVNLCRNIEQPNSKIRYGRFSFFFIPYSVSSIHPVSALALPQVRFIEMHVLKLAAEIREHSQSVGLVVFSYLNPILRMGLQKFCHVARAAGIDGTLITDLPIEESAEYLREARRNDLATIFLAAPTSTDQRLKQIAEVSTGFIYAISRNGVTGARDGVDKAG